MKPDVERKPEMTPWKKMINVCYTIRTEEDCLKTLFNSDFLLVFLGFDLLLSPNPFIFTLNIGHHLQIIVIS